MQLSALGCAKDLNPDAECRAWQCQAREKFAKVRKFTWIGPPNRANLLVLSRIVTFAPLFCNAFAKKSPPTPPPAIMTLRGFSGVIWLLHSPDRIHTSVRTKLEATETARATLANAYPGPAW
jgi:hypothetical protein